MTEPVRPLEALIVEKIAEWRQVAADAKSSERERLLALRPELAAVHGEAAHNFNQCANEIAALLHAAAPPAPTAEPVNWKASYHQACDDADAYKADADKRLAKMEQNWRSCQHDIAYLRERLKDTRAAPPERVSEGKESK